ncbi:hypothetical protein OG21DRAFT_1603156 [Imleria badia]|nr:hypothetical protein OG21DRAFT_1603156 [Imleria badia]
MSLTRPKCNPLLVTDTFHIILDFLSEPEPDLRRAKPDIAEIRPPQNEGQRALASLAQTCRVFSEPSLNCLWRKLGSLRPLLRCIFTVEVVDTRKNLRPPSLAEWSIINRYSRRIQELEVSEDNTLFLLECSIFEPNFLPNLRVLKWVVDDYSGSLACIRPLLGPKLVSFDLFLELETGDHKELSSLLKTLPSHCPGLKFVSFDLFPDRNAESVSPILSRTICGFEKLARLAIDAVIDGVALQHLVMSPQITDLVLRIRQSSQLEDLSLLPSDTPFSGMKNITLIGPDLGSMIGLLRPEGQVFSSTEFRLESPPTSQLTLAFLTLLASPLRRSSLQSLALGWEDDSDIPDFELQDNPYIISHDTLRPLVFFHNLRELSIDLMNHISLNDEELVDLARGWPLLHFLHLVSGDGPPAKHLTLQVLVSLVVTCPELERVDLDLDARVVPTTGVGVGVRSTIVKELNFQESPIDDPRLVAEFLSQHFPSTVLTELLCTRRYFQEWVQLVTRLEYRRIDEPPSRLNSVAFPCDLGAFILCILDESRPACTFDGLTRRADPLVA